MSGKDRGVRRDITSTGLASYDLTRLKPLEECELFEVAKCRSGQGLQAQLYRNILRWCKPLCPQKALSYNNPLSILGLVVVRSRVIGNAES